MHPPSAIRIALLLSSLTCAIANAWADAFTGGLSSSSSSSSSSAAAAFPLIRPSPLPSVGPSSRASLAHAVVVHGWTDDALDEPPVSCSLSVAAWQPADFDAHADADAIGGGGSAIGGDGAARGHWRIQQRWRMHSPTLILTLTPLHADPPSLHSASAKALALPQLGADWSSSQPLDASRWLLQLRCATAAGRRIPALPERGIQVDADGEAVSHFVMQPPSAGMAAKLFNLRRHLHTPIWLRRLRRIAISRIQTAWLRVAEWPVVRELKWAFVAVTGHATDAVGELLRFAAPAAFWRSIEEESRPVMRLARRLLQSIGGGPSSVCSMSGVLTAVAALALLHLSLALGLMLRQHRAETSAHLRRRPALLSLPLIKSDSKGLEERPAWRSAQQSIDRTLPAQVERPWLAQQVAMARPPLSPASSAERKQGAAAVDAPPSLMPAPSAVALARPPSPLEQLGSAIAAADEAAAAAAALLAARPSARPAVRRPLRHISAASPPPSRGSECALQ